jgi:hypothetical protein
MVSSEKVTATDTRFAGLCANVAIMVTKKPKRRGGSYTKAQQLHPQKYVLYVRAWREFMGTKAVDLAAALGIERESYYRLEKLWWTISSGEQAIMAGVMGVKPSQLWFRPPEKGQQVRHTPDELMEDIPENMRPAAVMALRGMAGK